MKDKKIKSKNGSYNEESNDFEIHFHYGDDGHIESETLIDKTNEKISKSRSFSVESDKNSPWS